MKKAFTMAEVLIALVIIGIIAAITIPNLFNSYKKQEYSTRLKKFHSTIQQAILLSELDHGNSKDWEFITYPKDPDTGNHADYEGDLKYTFDWVHKYLLPYMKYNKVTKGVYIPEFDNQEQIIENVSVYMSDGSLFKLWRGDCMDILYDVNAEKAPNKDGYDIFRYTFCTDGYGLTTYLKRYAKNRTTALTKCKSNPLYCSVLLEYDNWEFKDDYPYKL